MQKLRRDSIDRIKGKIRYWREAYPKGEITKEEIIKSFGAWDVHAAHGDTYSLRQKYAAQVEEIIGEKIKLHRKINSNKRVRELRRQRQLRNIEKKKQAQEASRASSFFTEPVKLTT